MKLCNNLIKYLLLIMILLPTASIALIIKPPIHDPKPEPFGSDDGGPLGAHHSVIPSEQPSFKPNYKSAPYIYFLENYQCIEDDECIESDECCDLDCN